MVLPPVDFIWVWHAFVFWGARRTHLSVGRAFSAVLHPREGSSLRRFNDLLG